MIEGLKKRLNLNQGIQVDDLMTQLEERFKPFIYLQNIYSVHNLLNKRRNATAELEANDKNTASALFQLTQPLKTFNQVLFAQAENKAASPSIQLHS